MQRIRIHKKKQSSKDRYEDPLPLNPRDPDIVRAKALAKQRLRSREA